MITVKALLETPCQASPDGKHWEPALPPMNHVWWKVRIKDAWAVWRGDAIAVRQTTKRDLAAMQKGQS